MIKSDDIISCFHSDKIVRTSTTPKDYKDATAIPREIVIFQWLIKKVLIINEDFAQNIHTKDRANYLFEKVLEKQGEIYSEMQALRNEINPLIINRTGSQ